MEELIKFVKISKENLELACEVQNNIFPEEDARENYIEMVNQAPYRKELDYYLVFIEDKTIGVTGVYAYYEYPDDAWLGWFGILKQYRHNGYGGLVLDKTIDLAKKKGYKKFRLYTDENAKSAHKLYESRGLIGELYDNKDDKIEGYDGKVFVYSISLTEEKIDLWNNRILGLKEQGKKQELYK